MNPWTSFNPWTYSYWTLLRRYGDFVCRTNAQADRLDALIEKRWSGTPTLLGQRKELVSKILSKMVPELGERRRVEDASLIFTIGYLRLNWTFECDWSASEGLPELREFLVAAAAVDAELARKSMVSLIKERVTVPLCEECLMLREASARCALRRADLVDDRLADWIARVRQVAKQWKLPFCVSGSLG